MRSLAVGAVATVILVMAARGHVASAPPASVHAAPIVSAASAEGGLETPTTEDGRERLPDWVEDGIRRYGPISVFFAFVISGVGLHLSEDLILIPTGFLAASDPHQSVRLFWEFAFWGYLGIVLGDTGWFLMCRTFGTRFLHSRWFKRLMHPRRLLEVKHQMDHRGAFVLLAARFVPGTRTPVITMGGLLHMSWAKFLIVELSAALVTVPLQMSVGWIAAKAASSAGVTRLSHQIAIGIGVTVACLILLYLAHRWIQRRSTRRRPLRAPARWLRIYDARTLASPA